MIVAKGNKMSDNMGRKIAYYLRSDGRPWWGESRSGGRDIIMREELLADKAFNFPVENVALYFADGRKSDMSSAIVRTDEMIQLGACGPKMRPVQQEELITFAFDIADEMGIPVSTAGIIGDGEKSWIMCKLKEPTIIGTGDAHNIFVAFMLGRDSSMGFSGMGGMIRIVCENTFNAFRSEGKKTKSAIFNLKQTQNIKDRMKDAKRQVLTTLKRGEILARRAALLAEIVLTPKRQKEIAKSLVEDIIVPGKIDAPITLESVLEYTDSPEQKIKAKQAATLDKILDIMELEQSRMSRSYNETSNAYLLANAATDYLERSVAYRGDPDEVIGSLFMDQVIGKNADRKIQVMESVARQTLSSDNLNMLYQMNMALAA